MIDNKTLVAGGLIIAVIIGVVAVFLASGDPDGLESTALVVQGQKSLTGGTPAGAEISENTEGKFAYNSPMPDYSLGEERGTGGGTLAIVVGTILAFIVALGLVYGIKAIAKKNNAKQNQ